MQINSLLIFPPIPLNFKHMGNTILSKNWEMKLFFVHNKLHRYWNVFLANCFLKMSSNWSLDMQNSKQNSFYLPIIWWNNTLCQYVWFSMELLQLQLFSQIFEILDPPFLFYLAWIYLVSWTLFFLCYKLEFYWRWIEVNCLSLSEVRLFVDFFFPLFWSSNKLVSSSPSRTSLVLFEYLTFLWWFGFTAIGVQSKFESDL